MRKITRLKKKKSNLIKALDVISKIVIDKTHGMTNSDIDKVKEKISIGSTARLLEKDFDLICCYCQENFSRNDALKTDHAPYWRFMVCSWKCFRSMIGKPREIIELKEKQPRKRRIQYVKEKKA